MNWDLRQTGVGCTEGEMVVVLPLGTATALEIVNAILFF